MRVCPVCKKDTFTKISDLKYHLFDDLKLSGDMQLAQCNHCKFIYNRTQLLEDDFSAYYHCNEYYLESTSPGSGGYSNRDTKRYADIYDQVSSYLPSKDPAILDFGCGKGGMLRWLTQNVTAKLTGVEASQTCRSFVKKDLSIPVHTSLTGITNNVDVVILSHVLEHIYSPRRLMKELKGISHDSSIIYIEVPMAEAYLSPEIKWQELYFEHINHFSETGLSLFLAVCGFNILKKGTKYFYKEDKTSSKCQYCIATLGKEQLIRIDHPPLKGLQLDQIPASTIISEIVKDRRPVSIWGISQYTQLVLGTYPKLLKKIKHLFDSSSAKKGRSIGGIKIRSPKELPLLGTDDILLLPNSSYHGEMITLLEDIGFMGQTVTF